jgi:hypothetical protein
MLRRLKNYKGKLDTKEYLFVNEPEFGICTHTAIYVQNNKNFGNISGWPVLLAQFWGQSHWPAQNP